MAKKITRNLKKNQKILLKEAPMTDEEATELDLFFLEHLSKRIFEPPTPVDLEQEKKDKDGNNLGTKF